MGKRPAMIGSVIRTIIAPALRECPPQCGIVSITDVEVSPDLSYATVTVSALTDPEAAVEFLRAKRGSLQAMLTELGSHRTPRLRFEVDRAAAGARRVEELLEAEAKKYSEDSSGTSQEQGR